MAWPNTRLTTYTPGSPVKSNDLNALEDAAIAGHHGDFVLPITGSEGRVVNGAGVGNVSVDVLSGGLTTLAAVDLFWGLRLLQGARIKSVTARVFGNGTVDVTAAVIRAHNLAGGSTVIFGPTATNNISAAWQDIVMDTTDHILAAGEAPSLHLSINAAGLTIATLRVAYDHPV
jgi:hypothetical protein